MSFLNSLASLYRGYLAQWYLFRLLKEGAVALYRLFVFLRSRVRQIEQSGYYKFQSMTGLPDTAVVKRLRLTEGRKTLIPAPDFSGFGADLARKKNGPITISEPALELLELPESIVVGGVDFIFSKGKAIHHDMFEPASHQCPGQNVGVTTFDRERLGLRLNLTQRAVHLKSGISLIGQCSQNYAHWLTETLPKLAMVDTCIHYADFALLVDDGLHPNIYESLELLNNSKRRVIKVSRWSAVTVENLVCLSSPGYERYVPQGLSARAIAPYVNRFSSFALGLLRERAREATFGLDASSDSRAFYFARSRHSKNVRQITNSDEIEALLKVRNISLCASDTLSFVEQIHTCQATDVLIAPIGAVLANMIFCRPGSRIIVLSPYYHEASYYYYSNLAGVLGHQLHYVLGAQEGVRRHPQHRNYTIEAAVLGQLLSSSDC